jgi:hypothetical protein
VTKPPDVGRPDACPPWCTARHGSQSGEEDRLHVSPVLLVRGMPVRLCTTIDPESARNDGPYVLIGSDEYTLYEADALIDALTQLVDDAGTGITRRAEA